MVFALLILAAFPSLRAQEKPPASQGEDGRTSQLLRTTSGQREITARFHLGKGFCEELREFPVDNNRLLIIDLTIKNDSTEPVFLYLDQVWLHIDEEDQQVDYTHAEAIAPRVYRNPYAENNEDAVNISGPVTVIGTPGTREGELMDPRGNVGGVFIDLAKIKKHGAPPMSLEKFVFTMFEKEFNQTYLKPGETASGFLYFHLPWSFQVLSPMQLHLEDIFGVPEDIRLVLE
jgi:hypothetical protein